MLRSRGSSGLPVSGVVYVHPVRLCVLLAIETGTLYTWHAPPTHYTKESLLQTFPPALLRPVYTHNLAGCTYTTSNTGRLEKPRLRNILPYCLFIIKSTLLERSKAYWFRIKEPVGSNPSAPLDIFHPIYECIYIHVHNHTRRFSCIRTRILVEIQQRCRFTVITALAWPMKRWWFFCASKNGRDRTPCAVYIH